MKKIRHRVSVVVIRDQKILGFHAEDPNNHRKYFFIPGGKIEDSETAAQAAIRETLEETGYHIQVSIHPSIERRYDFEWDGVINDCRTIFLAGTLLTTQQENVDDADYHRGVEWVPVADIEEIFAYHSDILEPIQELSRHLLKTKSAE